MQEVVGRHVVQLIDGAAIRIQQTADDESHHHAPNVAQKLGHTELLAGGIGDLHNRMAAVRFQGRTGGRPDEIGAADSGVPKFP